MNSIERMVNTIQRKPVDRLPVYPLINSVSRKALGISYEEWTKDYKKCAECIIKTTDELDVDCICTLVDLSVEAADFGQELLYFEDKAACPNDRNRLIKTEEDYAKIKYINPRETPRMSEHIEMAKLLYEARGQEKPIVGFVLGPLAILSMMRGQSEMFMDCIEEPELLEAPLKEITRTLIDFCDGLIDAGCHALMFDTLYASASIMSPKMWDDLEGDFIQEICDHVHARGCMVMLHNCGNGIYFKEQIARINPCLISFLHVPFDCKDMQETKEKYGDKVVLMGALEPGWVLFAKDDELRDACKAQIDVLGKGGGFVLATGCEYPAPLDFEKARLMVELAKNTPVITE